MALYHTYRPKNFDDVAYQAHIIETIKNQVINNKVGHAYLFAGPRGIGKTSTARILAKAVNLDLKEGTAEFDDTSEEAKEINESRSIDIIEIDAASHTGVDNVREHIIENARFQPTSLKKKVFIIDEVHMLSNSAFNALLKTLEEPPAHVMFILATTELHKIPETIISRCQLFRFKRVPFEEMKKHLAFILEQEKIKMDDDVLERIINKSDGCVRDAISLLEQVLASGEKHITKDSVAMFLPTSDVSTTLAFLSALVEKNLAKALEPIHTTSSDGVRMEQFAHDTLELLRILMISKATGNYTGTGIDLSDSAKKNIDILKKSISHHGLVKLADIVMKRKNQISSAPIPEMPIEMIAIEWCDDDNATDSDDSKSNIEANVPTSMEKTTTNSQQTTDTNKVETSKPVSSTVIETPDKNNTVDRGPSTLVYLADVKKHWSSWIKKVEQYSPSLVFILKMAECVKVEENVITLCVGFGFHRDKLMDIEIKKKLESAYEEFLDSPVVIDVQVKDDERSTDVVDTELTDLTAAFGGQIVG